MFNFDARAALHKAISPGVLFVCFSALIVLMMYLIASFLIWPDALTDKPKPYEFVTVIVAFFTFVVYSATLVVISYQIRMDHERRRKQATIEHIEKIKSIYRDNDHWLTKVHGDKVDISKLTEDERKSIQDMLSVLEHMSAGVLTGVFDLALIDRMSGAFLRRLYMRVEPLIESIRDEKIPRNSRIYADYETLVDKINELRKEGPYAPKQCASTQAVMGMP